MAPSQSKPSARRFYIHLSIDYGTTHLRVCAQFVPVGELPDMSKQRILCLGGNPDHIKQIVAFIKRSGVEDPEQAELRYGAQVAGLYEGLFAEGKIVILDGMKTMLFPTDESGPTRMRTMKQLLEMFGPGTDIAWVILRHLEHVFADIMESITSPANLHLASVDMASDDINPEAVKDMKIQTVFTVPESADPGRLQLFRQSIQKSPFGSHDLDFVSETEAAGAYLCRDHMTTVLRNRFAEPLSENEVIVVGDAGGSTFNVAAYRIRHLDGRMVLQLAGDTSSELCGSESITRKFVEDKLPTLKEGQLGLSILDIARQLAYRFQAEKHRFGNQNNWPDANIEIRLQPRYRGGDYVYVSLKRTKMTDWFNQAAGSIVKSLRVALSAAADRRVHIALTGGFFRNDYLRRQVRHSFPTAQFVWDARDVRLEEAAVRGACSPVENNGKKYKPLGFAIGCLMDEHFSKQVHGALAEVSKDLYGTRRYAASRWCELIPKGASADYGTVAFPEKYYLSADEPQLFKKLYWTRGDIRSGDWGHRYLTTEELASRNSTERTKVRDDLQEYGEELHVEFSSAMLQRYPVVKRSDGVEELQAQHEVWATTEFTIKGLDIRFAWTIEPPGIDLDTESLEDGRRRLGRQNKRKTNLGQIVLPDASIQHGISIQGEPPPADPCLPSTSTTRREPASATAVPFPRGTKRLATSAGPAQKSVKERTELPRRNPSRANRRQGRYSDYPQEGSSTGQGAGAHDTTTRDRSASASTFDFENEGTSGLRAAYKAMRDDVLQSDESD